MKVVFFGLGCCMACCFSCRNETLQSFERLYVSLQDSVAHYDNLSAKYLSEIESEEREYARRLDLAIDSQNGQIDSLIQVISDEAVNLNDRTVSTEYLVENNAAEHIRNANNDLLTLLIAEHPNRFPTAARTLMSLMNENSSGDDRSWAEQRFLNIPMAVSRAKLQQWKYQNSKARTLTLLDLSDAEIRGTEI
ncbi:MAG: hypothetical protein AAGI23_07695 [Bacteroidota bacterium]